MFPAHGITAGKAAYQVQNGNKSQPPEKKRYMDKTCLSLLQGIDQGEKKSAAGGVNMIIGGILVGAETGGGRDPEILLKSVAYNIILKAVIAPDPEQTENILRPGFNLACEKPAVLEKDKGFAVQGIMKCAGSIKIRIRPAYKPVAQVFKNSDAILTGPGK